MVIAKGWLKAHTSVLAQFLGFHRQMRNVVLKRPMFQVGKGKMILGSAQRRGSWGWCEVNI